MFNILQVQVMMICLEIMMKGSGLAQLCGNFYYYFARKVALFYFYFVCSMIDYNMHVHGTVSSMQKYNYVLSKYDKYLNKVFKNMCNRWCS